MDEKFIIELYEELVRLKNNTEAGTSRDSALLAAAVIVAAITDNQGKRARR